MFQPSYKMSVDEIMIAFKERSTMKQFMPTKSSKARIKSVFTNSIASANTSYFNSFKVFTEKTSKYASLGLGEKIVLSLCSSLEINFYCVYFDNCFF